jgi:hypothetical protein
MNHPTILVLATRKSKTQTQPKIKKSIERKLDEAIEMTFPASDPVSITEPAPGKNTTASTDSIPKPSKRKCHAKQKSGRA